MSKVITFSRTFPSYHPRKGEPTYFVEAILTQLRIDYTKHDYFVWLVDNNPSISEKFLNYFFCSLSHDIDPKSHTIRVHKKPLQVNDWFNPKCWAGKPYHKTPDGFWQIKFAPDIQMKKEWKFEANHSGYAIEGYYYSLSDLKNVAKNDGFTNSDDFELWFNLKKGKTLEAQIICWNENIEY